MPIVHLDFYSTVRCPACVPTITNALKTVPGVLSVDFEMSDKFALVCIEDQDESNAVEILKEAVSDVGFGSDAAYIVMDDIKQLDAIKKKRCHVKKMIRWQWAKGALGLAIGGGTLIASIFGLGLPLLALYLLGGLASLLALYLGKETYRDAFVQLCVNKRLSMDALFAVSTGVALVVSVLSFIFPVLPMMFDAALLILGFKHVGQAIQAMTDLRFSGAVFTARAPREIMVEGQTNKKAVKDLQPGDIIIVKKNQTVPVNAKYCPLGARTLREGRTEIYNTIETGRTLPQPLYENGAVLAGCVVPGHIDFVRLEVTATVENSYLACLDRRLKQEKLVTTKIELWTESALQYFVPIVFAVTTASVILLSVLMSPIAALLAGTTLLASSCPCALGMMVPRALQRARHKAAQYGAFCKNNQALEAAKQTRKVVFDLTGTLTQGSPRVTRCKVPKTMLGFLAAIEEKQDHPVPKAIYQHANKSPGLEMGNVTIKATHHAGVVADIDGHEFMVGNRELMQCPEYAINIDHLQDELKLYDYEHAVFFVKDRKVEGYVLLEDPLRDEAVPLINRLKAMGKEVHLCTGADEHTAIKQARRLGLDPETQVKANCKAEKTDGPSNDENTKSTEQDEKRARSPLVKDIHRKSEYIDFLATSGDGVAFIGDGPNDVLALKRSTCGIAVTSESGSAEAQNAAKILVNPNSLSAIAHVFEIAEQANDNIKQNLAFNLSYNLLTAIAFSGLLVTLGFALNPAIGAALMVAQIIFIIMNVERFYHRPLQPLAHPGPKASTRQIKRSMSCRFAPSCTVQPSMALERGRAVSSPIVRQKKRANHDRAPPLLNHKRPPFKRLGH